MEEKIVEDVRQQLNEAKGYWPQISAATGLTQYWLRAFANSRIVSPTVGMFCRLARGFGRDVELTEKK